MVNAVDFKQVRKRVANNVSILIVNVYRGKTSMWSKQKRLIFLLIKSRGYPSTIMGYQINQNLRILK